MKNKMKRKFLITIAILALSVIGIIVSVIFLFDRLNNTENPGIKTSQPIGELQDYEFPDFEPVWGKVAFPGEYNKEKDVLADYAYSDKYFTIDSTIYNPSLSTMSLCLELSVWSSRETDVWAEKTRNARKLLDEIGFEDFAQNDFWSDSPSTKSIGVVAAHKELEDSTLIALPVRGGGYFNEWGSNVNVGTTGEHTGFAEGRDNVVKFLEEYIVTHNITGRVKIWLVGYSRGGAVANLVAGYLNENELPNGATLAFEDLYCYAFEPPQGSIVELAGSDEEHCNIHNIVNPNDIVPMVAPVDWAFTRYNSTSRLLPTITTAEFESALAVMLEEYEEILAGVEMPDPDAAIYNVSEYAKRIDVNANPLNFLPGGDPMVDIQIVDDTSQTMNEVLTSFITAFADSLDGREKYNTSLEADLIHLLDQLMGYETGFEMDAVLETVKEAMTANGGENLKYVLAPVFALNWNSAEERVKEVIARLREVLPQPEGFNDLYGTAATLIEALGNLLVHNPDELLDIALAFTNSKVFQSHYEEITLAWVRAGDPHYTDTPYKMAVPETLRTVRVNCPVNVEIYDSEGKLVASMIDKVATTNNAVVGCAMNEDGEIIIHLPADAEYNIVTTATGDGEVNITLSEYNLVHSRVTRVQNYADIPVELGDVLTLTAPNLIEEEYTDEEQQGSTAEYKLSDNNGETISCQSETRGSEIEYFGVSVHTNNNFGAVNGGGQYLEGTFAMVEAQPVAGGEFIGWYIGSELVSTETAYRFAVDSDTTLTAHFSEVSLYALTFGTSGEGTVSNADYSYSAGSRVQLSAEAAEGYEFDHWETTGGTIEDASDAQTVFIVSDGDAAITAVFKIKVCSACHEELANGETHAAGCGVEEHYTCDGGEHGSLTCGHFACDSGEHGVLPCGHYACESGNHQALSCGHYGCVEGDHTAGACGTAGHFNCSGTHTVADCGTAGHYKCDGADHLISTCGIHHICAGGEHGSASCGTAGHYVCDNRDHGMLPCGHYGCVEGDHTAGACGTAGHFNCSGTHTVADCGTAGHYKCDGADHLMSTCGIHHICAGGEHGSASCGTSGHYVCDNRDHGTLSCGHYACDSGEHGKLTCGHYACDSGDHGTLSCGHYACESGNHQALPCGHYACGSGEHGMLPCGHYGCVEGDHTAGACGTAGHFNCSGTHTVADCGTAGHYKCDGADHLMSTCGIHHICAGGEHGSASCGTAGHYVCDGKIHETAGCQKHKLCDGNNHSQASCGTPGHYVCDNRDHGTLPCGHYGCVEGDHTAGACGTAGHFNCSGTHTAADCGTAGHYKCDGADHLISTCGNHYICAGGEHGSADCGTDGHYKCDGADHTTTMPCGHLACATGDHTAGACGTAGHFNCSGTHTVADCGTNGHYSCDGKDHTATDCGIDGHYACDSGDHTPILVNGWEPCGHYNCDESAKALTHEKIGDCGAHFQCDLSVADRNHGYCAYGCGYSLCSDEVPVPHDGTCYQWANYYCHVCNQYTGEAGYLAHRTSCNIASHYTCDPLVKDMDHSAYDCGGHYKCNPNEASLDHSAAACGTAGHYACDGYSHDVCAYCNKRKCEDWSEHGEGICNSGT